jgi:murein DD-endopeptidase MepM/ murein hydrolase activator NlpD
MSAIVANAPNANCDGDGLRRYTTRIKVIAHSHNHRDPINLSDDIMACQIGKNLKGVGKANLTVVARASYINMIYPNDYINIYFDIDDGQGWTRSFLGLVDRIEEDYTVSADGVPTTLYHIICSDFQKVLTKTNIYFNPNLFRRQDVAGEDFNAFNIGGVVLMTKGILQRGTPADIVLNMILLQLGFGSQWILPSSYPTRIEDRFRRQRAEYAQGRLLADLRPFLQPEDSERLRAIIRERGLSAFHSDLETEITTNLANSTDLASGDLETRTNAILQAAGLSRDQVTDIEISRYAQTEGVGSLAELLADRRLDQEIFGRGIQDSESRIQGAIRQFEAAELETQARTITDIMNLTDFFERRAIDGYAFDVSIWEQQGPLMNILKAVSNEAINELFFDLRPINLTPTGELDPNVFLMSGANWDRSSDEINGNNADLVNNTSGIRYMPSVIMREYPYSTVTRVDATGVSLTLRSADGTVGNLGKLFFGGVFSNRPNEPGRHLVSSDILNLEERALGLQPADRTYKHIDVAVISENEIRQSRLGRSDQEHFNLFEMFSDDVIGSDARYFMFDFLPIITPIHIMRHGLRTRTASTRFIRYPPAAATAARPQTEAPEEEVAAEEVIEAAEPIENLSEQLGSPIVPGAGVGFHNADHQRYGYRDLNGRTQWNFHNGIDISGPGPSSIDVNRSVEETGDVVGPTDVIAIADGLIVGSAPPGTPGVSRYGNVVVIYHQQFSTPDQKVFSFYAHLAHRDHSTGNINNIATKEASFNSTYTGHGDENWPVQPIRKGQKIGSVGRTRGSVTNPQQLFFNSGDHLHFEIDHRIPSGGGRRGAPEAIPYSEIPQGTRPRPEANNPYSSDPVEWFTERGADLLALIGGREPVEFEGATDTSEDGPGPPSRITEDTPESENEEQQAISAGSTQLFRGSADSIDARQQLGRWSLLQDHWYQHNLEYLSGQLVMRGAPEIRVGYRLDIKERNASFYVQSVTHNWQFPNEMQTTLQVNRGQPNNPYPAYALPPLEGFGAPFDARRARSRLAHYFIVPDPIAIRRAIALRSNSADSAMDHPNSSNNTVNVVDQQELFERYGEGVNGLLVSNSVDYNSVADDVAIIAAATGIDETEVRTALNAAAILDETIPQTSAPSLSGTDAAEGIDGSYYFDPENPLNRGP